MSDTLARIESIVAGGGEPDDVLRSVVAELAAATGVSWAGIAFVEGDEMALGPEAGAVDPARRIHMPIAYEGDLVAELQVDGVADLALLERAASLVSVHCLVGWDTGGIPWGAA